MRKVGMTAGGSFVVEFNLSEIREVRWLALGILGRIVADEPEQAWQVFRRIAREGIVHGSEDRADERNGIVGHGTGGISSA